MDPKKKGLHQRKVPIIPSGNLNRDLLDRGAVLQPTAPQHFASTLIWILDKKIMKTMDIKTPKIHTV